MIDVAERWPRDMRRPESEVGLAWAADWAEPLVNQVRRAVREQPELAALGALGLGFYLGWRLRPW